MTRAVSWHPAAEVEFVADVDWYELREPGLGDRFEAEVLAAVEAAAEDPQAWPAWPGWLKEPEVRSKSVGAFPYRVVFSVEADQITVVAVAHAKRRPGYWADRDAQ